MGWEMNESTMHTSKFRPVIMAGIPWQIGRNPNKALGGIWLTWLRARFKNRAFLESS